MKPYRFTTFNIFKAHIPACREVIHALVGTNNFVAIQEWVSSFELLPRVHVVHTPTFALPFKNGVTTGTAILSQEAPTSFKSCISVAREFGYATRKSLTVAEYVVGGKSLTIFNCHAPNFVSNQAWFREMETWLASIGDGPAIFAGDFNTWNMPRTKYIKNAFTQLGFTYAEQEQHKGMQLDHIWTRGIEPQKVHRPFSKRVSDHYPITLEFLF